MLSTTHRSLLELIESFALSKNQGVGKNYLSGNFSPQFNEATAANLEVVEGKVYKGL